MRKLAPDFIGRLVGHIRFPSLGATELFMAVISHAGHGHLGWF